MIELQPGEILSTIVAQAAQSVASTTPEDCIANLSADRAYAERFLHRLSHLDDLLYFLTDEHVVLGPGVEHMTFTCAKVLSPVVQLLLRPKYLGGSTNKSLCASLTNGTA